MLPGCDGPLVSVCVFYLCFLAFVFLSSSPAWFCLHTCLGSVWLAQSCYLTSGLEIRMVVCSVFCFPHACLPAAPRPLVSPVYSEVQFFCSVGVESSVLSQWSCCWVSLFCPSCYLILKLTAVFQSTFSTSPWHIVSPFMVQVQLQYRFHWKWTFNSRFSQKLCCCSATGAAAGALNSLKVFIFLFMSTLCRNV